MPLSSEYSRGFNPNKLNNNPNNNTSNNNNPNNSNTNTNRDRERDRDGNGKYYKDDKQRYGGNRRYGSSSYQQNNHPHQSSHSYSSYPPYLQNASYPSNGNSNGSNAPSSSNSNAYGTSNSSSGSPSNTAPYAQQGTINPFSSRRQNSHQEHLSESSSGKTTENQSHATQPNSQRDSIHGHYKRQSSETNINNISNTKNSIPSYGSNSYKGSYGTSVYRSSHPSEYYDGDSDNNSSLNITNNNNTTTTNNNNKHSNFRSRNSSLSNPEINPGQPSKNNTNINNSTSNNTTTNINGQSSRDQYKDDSSSPHSSSNPSSQNSSSYNPSLSYSNRRHLSYGKERGYHDPSSNNPHAYSKRSGDIIGGSSNNKSGDLISSPPNSLKDPRYRSRSRDYGYLSGNRQPRPNENYYNGPNQQQPQQQQQQKSPQPSSQGSPSHGSISQPSNINNNSRKSSYTKDDDKFLKSRHNSYEYSNNNKINPFNNATQSSEKRNMNIKEEEDLFPLKSSANSKSNRPSVSPSAAVKPIVTATTSTASSLSFKTDVKIPEEKGEKSVSEKRIQAEEEPKNEEETMRHEGMKNPEEKVTEALRDPKKVSLDSNPSGKSSPPPLTSIATSSAVTTHFEDLNKIKMNDKDMELQKALIDSSDDDENEQTAESEEVKVETEDASFAEIPQASESELNQSEKTETKTNSKTDLNAKIFFKQENDNEEDTSVVEPEEYLNNKNGNDENNKTIQNVVKEAEDTKQESPEELSKKNLEELPKSSIATEPNSQILHEKVKIIENDPSTIESKDEISDIKKDTEEKTTELPDVSVQYKTTDLKLEPSVKAEENIEVSETVENNEIKTGEQGNIDSTLTASRDLAEESEEEPDEPIEVIDSCIFPLNRVESKLWDLKHHSKVKIHRELKYLTKAKFTELSQYDFYKSNLMIFKQVDAPILIKKLLEQDELVDAKKQVLVEEYVSRSRIYERRKQIMNKQVESLHKTAEDKKAEETKEQQKQPTSRRSRHHGDSVRTEAEFMEILASLERERENDPLVRAQYGAAIIPDMIMDPLEKFVMSRNLDSNNIRLDKIKWAERIKTDPIDTFTEAEHEKFCEAFALFPKRFGRISSYLGSLRTPEECVLHYYRTKKETNFKQIVASRNRRTTRKAAANRRKHVTKGKQGITANTTSGTVTPTLQDEANDTKSEVENTATADNSSKTTTPEVEDGTTSTIARGNKRKRSTESVSKTNKKKQDATAATPSDKASTESPSVSESATEQDTLAGKSHIKDEVLANKLKQPVKEKFPVTLEPAKRKFEIIAPKKTDITQGKSTQATFDSSKPSISEEHRKKIKISKRRKDDIQIKPKPESHVEILAGNIPSVTVTVPIPPSSAAAVAAATARSSEAIKYQMLAAATKNSADREMIEKAALERAAQAGREAAARLAAANNGSIVDSETPSVASYIRSTNPSGIHNPEKISGPTFVTTTLAPSVVDNGANISNPATRTTVAQPEFYHSQVKFERTPQASHNSKIDSSTHKGASDVSKESIELPQQESHAPLGQSEPPSLASSVSPPSSQSVPPRSSSSPQPGGALTSSGGKFSHDEKKSKEKRITSSYWSVQEITQFPELLKEHGTNWENISKALGSKTTTMVRNYYVRGAATHTEWKELIDMSTNNNQTDSVKSETTGQNPEAAKPLVTSPASAPVSSAIKVENDRIPSSSHVGILPSVAGDQARFSDGASTSMHNITNANSASAVSSGSSLTETNPWSSTTNGPPVGYFYSGSSKGEMSSSTQIHNPPQLQSLSAAAGSSYPHYAYNPIKNEVREQPPVVAKSSFISQMTQPSEPLRKLTETSGITNTSSAAPVHKFNPIRMVSLLNDDPSEPPVSKLHSEYVPPRPLAHTSVANLLSTPSATQNFSVSSIMNPSTSSSSYAPLSTGYTPFGTNSSYTNNNPIPQPPKAASIRITSLLNSDDNESGDHSNRSSNSSFPFPRPIQSLAPPPAPPVTSLQQPQYMQPFHPPRRPFADMLNPMPAPSYPPYSQPSSQVTNINNLVNNSLPKVGVTLPQNHLDNNNGDRYRNTGSNPLDALANAAFNNKQ